MVKTPFFPTYERTQKLLQILDGEKEEDFRSMRASIKELIGTPQKPVDWTDPDNWIPERLEGDAQAFAMKIWTESKRKVNPRHLGGIKYLMNNYDLIVSENGVLKLTAKGKTFVSNSDNEVIQEIDREEGLLYILYLCSVNKNSSRKAFLKDWSSYLRANSNYTKESVFKDTLRRRLVNLLERELVSRDGVKYDITTNGKEYLERFKDEIKFPSTSEETELNNKVEEFKNKQKTILKDYLYKLSPYEFEWLVKELLDSMGYQDVEVTSQTNDKGVDVVGVIQNGITKVKEVIQVKRVTSNIQRPVLDALRGSLHRFDAFQGTIITLSDFAKGTKNAAFERGAAPITLINGDKLIDYLIENEIGIKLKPLDYFVVDSTYFEASEEEVEE
jgi:restriction system protein